ncbi:MAG: T9SS type B sorting domain-containing protein [Bacteroidota bacterium]
MFRQFLYALLVLLFSQVLIGQDFPAETIVCRVGAFTLESPLTDGQTYVYQWERSFDGGGSWLVTGSNSPELTVNNPNSGIRYRMAYASDETCLADAACRQLTNATRLDVNIPTFAQGVTICSGDTVFVGNVPLLTPGNHETIISTPAGCDSIVSTFVQVLSAADDLFFVDLCPGELFRGQAVSGDTVITESFTAASGCDSTVTYEINLAFSDDSRIEGLDRLCAGETADLTAPGGYSAYAWSTGSTGERITAGTSGSYCLTITDFTGCTLELSHELTVTELEVESVTTTQPSCPETATGALSIVARGDQDLLYSIDGGESFQLETTFTELPAGEYTLAVENAEGCSVAQQLSLTDAPALNLMAQAPTNLNIERGDSVTLSVLADFPVTTYQWSGARFLSCTDCPDPVAYPPVDATFTVEAIAAGGCSVSQQFTFTVKDARRLYAPTAFSPNADDQNDYWRIYTGPRAEAISGLQIADRWGGIRFEQTAPELPPSEAGWDGRDRNGQEMNAGTYVFSATIRYTDGSTQKISGPITLMR